MRFKPIVKSREARGVWEKWNELPERTLVTGSHVSSRDRDWVTKTDKKARWS